MTNSGGNPSRNSYSSTPVPQQVFNRNLNSNGMSGKDQSTRRFPPRPSPERLQAQVKSVEANQEKMFAVMGENQQAMLETMEALLSEVSS